MQKNFDAILETKAKKLEMLQKWRTYVKKIAKAFKKELPDAEIYIFGSVIEGREVGGSDVDILVVSNLLPSSNLERAKLKAKIEKDLKLPLYHPFEMHLANKEEAKHYFKHVKKLEKLNKTSAHS